MMGKRLFALLPFYFLTFLPVGAQYNIDRLINIGRSALYYEDYVLSMQYFNQAIAAKPYLYEPWFFRGVAKFYLDDFAGAEADCSEAQKRNPYVTSIYDLRALCRIRQERYTEAAEDYTRALKYDPQNQGMWHNRVLCHIQNKDYERALGQLDTMLTRWSHYARGYTMQAEVYLLQADTTAAIKALENAAKLDPYDGETWAARAVISLSRQQWKDAEGFLDKTIHLLSRHVTSYINRALARLNQNNLRGAMADYDTALDLDPNNFLGHYNRGLLRAQVGDDNRGIEDFDFVLSLEPDNLMALFNRALLLEQTGDLRGAIRDYSKVIGEYPNFWFGLQHRANCYRRLGQSRQAELDEFRILKAQMDKRYGKRQPRLNRQQMRRRSDEDLEKYNQIVVADEQDVEHEYKSQYRGKVQNRKVEATLLPMFELTLQKHEDKGVRSVVAYDANVEEFNSTSGQRPLYINSTTAVLDEHKSSDYFNYIDSLSTNISQTATVDLTKKMLLIRAVAYGEVQNYESAIDDLSTYLGIDSLSVLALWQRAVCQSKINQFQASEGTNIDLKTANVLGDMMAALRLAPKNVYLYYNRATLYALRKDYRQAVEDYTRAVDLEPAMAEAYYNRGLCHIFAGEKEKGIRDLSKAGEMGLYTAYSIIKRYR
jgi:tetratricopeptide (TPR) repeat protein